MQNDYIDHYGRFHTKPVTKDNPIPTNNGWIYTAYMNKLDSKIPEIGTVRVAVYCAQNKIRTPNIDTPPISRDEILGLVYLYALHLNDLNGWNFSPYYYPAFNPFKLLHQLWELRPEFTVNGIQFKHRNYFWQNKLDQLYRFAFSVPVQDRYSILKHCKKFNWFKPSHLFYAAVSKIDSMGKPSGIRYLKYGGEKNKQAMLTEFPEDHPIHNL